MLPCLESIAAQRSCVDHLAKTLTKTMTMIKTTTKTKTAPMTMSKGKTLTKDDTTNNLVQKYKILTY